MERTQVYLTEKQKEALKRRSERTGKSIAELIRRAIDEQFEASDPGVIREHLEESYGAWSGADDSGPERTRDLRGEWSDRSGEDRGGHEDGP